MWWWKIFGLSMILVWRTGDVFSVVTVHDMTSSLNRKIIQAVKPKTREKRWENMMAFFKKPQELRKGEEKNTKIFPLGGRTQLSGITWGSRVSTWSTCGQWELLGNASTALEVFQSNLKCDFYFPNTIFPTVAYLIPWSPPQTQCTREQLVCALRPCISDDYRREFEASLPAVCCVWTPSTWGRGPRAPSSSKAKIGFKGISGFSLVTSNLDGLDPVGKLIISSNFSFWIDTPFSFGCSSKLRVLKNFQSQIKMS